MDGDTTMPNEGQSRDTASDFKIVDVTQDKGFRCPSITYHYNGRDHTGLDAIIYKRSKDEGRYYLPPADREDIKKRGIRYREEHGLLPWPEIGDPIPKAERREQKKHDAPPAPEQLHEAPRPAVDVDAIRAKSRKEAKKALPPKHELEILGDMFTDPNTGEASIKALRDGIEEIWSVFDLDTELENFPSEYDPHLSGIVHDMVIRTNAERFTRAEAEHDITWPVGGIEPIMANTFTEARALEVGIIREDQRGIMRVSVHEAARYIMDHITFANIRTGENVDLHYYDRGTYHRQGEVWIGMAAERLLGQYSTIKNVAEILAKIKRTCQPKDTNDQDPEGWICVKNGYLCIYTRELKPHHPSMVFTTQSPVTYDPTKTECPHFARFLVDITDLPTDPQAILEMMGYCLMPGYKHQWLFLLLGEGANGKGTLMRVLTSILGDSNVSQVTLHDLANRPFAACQLHRKMANICGDLDATHLKNTGLIKMVTGDDRIMADRKNRDALNFRNQAKIIALCNRIPYSQDDTGGFTRRPRVFLFPRQFMGDERDPNLINELTTEDEKTAILNKMLDGLDRLNKQGYLTGRENDRYEAERYVIMQNPAVKFLADNVVSDADRVEGEIFQYGFREDYNELHSHFVDWCKDNGFPDTSKEKFEKEVIRYFSPNVYLSKWGKADNPEKMVGRCWVGIRYDPTKNDD